MNGFRVTILVLLCMTVGLMFYAVTVVIPGKQEQYELYKAGQKIDEYQQRNADHMARMEQLGPEVESPEMLTARTAAEEAQKAREQKLSEAEEAGVLAAARRKQEAEQAKLAEQATKEANQLGQKQTFPLGHVASYDSEWNIVMITTQTNTPMEPGRQLAVRRGDLIICEIVVDALDEESQQVSATIKPGKLTNLSEEEQAPRAGDEVVESPFATGNDTPAPSDSDIAPWDLPDSSDSNEVNATLVPIP